MDEYDIMRKYTVARVCASITGEVIVVPKNEYAVTHVFGSFTELMEWLDKQDQLDEENTIQLYCTNLPDCFAIVQKPKEINNDN